MQRQGPVRPEDAKRVLLQPCRRPGSAFERTELRGRKGQRRGLSEAHGVIGRLARLAQARGAGKHLFQQPERRKQRELLRPLLEVLGARQAIWRRAVLTGPGLTSPPGGGFQRLWGNGL